MNMFIKQFSNIGKHQDCLKKIPIEDTILLRSDASIDHSSSIDLTINIYNSFQRGFSRTVHN